MTQSVASMESQLRQQIEQKHRAESDLLAVRDLCVKLDQQKDSLMEQLGDKDTLKAHVMFPISSCSSDITRARYVIHSSVLTLAQYEAQLSKLKAELTILEDQMTRDRVTVERLEALLDQARQESINAQTTNQELQNEIVRLRQKVAELQSKLYVSFGYVFVPCFYIMRYIILLSSPAIIQIVRIRGAETVSESGGGIQQAD